MPRRGGGFWDRDASRADVAPPRRPGTRRAARPRPRPPRPDGRPRARAPAPGRHRRRVPTGAHVGRLVGVPQHGVQEPAGEPLRLAAERLSPAGPRPHRKRPLAGRPGDGSARRRARDRCARLRPRRSTRGAPRHGGGPGRSAGPRLLRPHARADDDAREPLHACPPAQHIPARRPQVELDRPGGQRRAPRHRGDHPHRRALRRPDLALVSPWTASRPSRGGRRRARAPCHSSPTARSMRSWDVDS